MCGRFALYSDFPSLARSLKLTLAEDEVTPRYNVAPGTWISAIRRHGDNGELSLDALWWGYRPRWADDKAPQPINATVEKVATSPYFRGAFAHHRCLVPANGWYEWLAVNGRKQPHYLTLRDGEALWFAGIWYGAPGRQARLRHPYRARPRRCQGDSSAHAADSGSTEPGALARSRPDGPRNHPPAGSPPRA